MEYKGYRLEQDGTGIIVEGVRDFEPVHIFECGQCFRWVKEKDGSYLGVVKDKVSRVKFENGTLTIENSSIEDFKDMWFDYFDLGRDYSEIKEQLCKDEIMKEAIKFGHGIRILKQDIREVLISFIISANNMIPRIMKTVDTLSKMYGREIPYEGSSFYTFPSLDRLSNSGIEQLEVCRAGFRCKYILKASQMVQNGSINLDAVKEISTDKARSELIKLPGVGPKVADCVLLYSGTKYDVFPTDVWVKRIMESLYFKREATFKEIQQFSRDYFGPLAGFAQQYLFYYARENSANLNIKSVNGRADG